MATWPSYAQIADIGEKPQTAVVRTPMESGPPKETKVRSRRLIQRPIKVAIDSLADYNAFKAWVDDTLDMGKNKFNWTDPVDGQLKQAKIVNGIYDAKPLGNSLVYWDVTLTLETLE